ncbi:hypothetical protein BC830DRAFT_19951 [Chytriomyces sp. MP71]|nr:hypothetical protein BC830DRAFT_19951 [Chytriomyces sp. MP71]
MTHSPAFIRHFTVLRAEFADSTCRLTRLSESMDEKLKVIKAQEAAEDAARNEAERKGIFTNKGGRGQTSIQVTNVNTLAMEALKLQKANIKEAMEQADMEMKEIMRKHRQSEDETEIPTDIEDCGFDVADLIIYLRSMISNFKSRREIETFLTRAKAMLHGDRVTLLREYKLISSLTPGSHLLDILDDYDGVNL